jgi:hypothetical protein
VIEEDSAGNSYSVGGSVDTTKTMGCKLGNGIGTSRFEGTSLSQSATSTKHLRSRRLVKANISASYHLKEPCNTQMVDIGGVEGASDGFSYVSLGCEVVDFIWLYSFNRSLDRFVFEEFQRYRLDGLRYQRRRRATITTKNTIAQSK